MKSKNLHPDAKRILELEALKYDEEISQEEWGELENLREKRKRDIKEAIPRPQCCEAIKKYPAVNFYINHRNEEGKNSFEADGGWHITLPKNDYWSHSLEWLQNIPAPKFCPFCGAPLPKMKKKAELPEYVSLIQYDSDYCDTCGDRLMRCQCDPPEAAWEIDDD